MAPAAPHVLSVSLLALALVLATATATAAIQVEEAVNEGEANATEAAVTTRPTPTTTQRVLKGFEPSPQIPLLVGGGGDTPELPQHRWTRTQPLSAATPGDSGGKSLSDYEDYALQVLFDPGDRQPSEKGQQGLSKPVKFDVKPAVLPRPTVYDHPYPYHIVSSQAAFGDVGRHVYSSVATSGSVGPSSGNGGSAGNGHGVSKGTGAAGGLLKKALSVLTAFIPLGLFLAAIQPSVLSINTTSPTQSRKRARAEAGEDVLEDALRSLLESHDPTCEAHVVCAMARGDGLLQTALWRVAHGAPEAVTRPLGLSEVFTAIREDTCDQFKCQH